MMQLVIIVSLVVSNLGTAVFAQCQGGSEGKLVLHTIVYLVNPTIRLSLEPKKASRISTSRFVLEWAVVMWRAFLSPVCITGQTSRV